MMNYNQSPTGWMYPNSMPQTGPQTVYTQMPIGNPMPSQTPAQNPPMVVNPSPTPFVGRYITDVSETLPSETPMDGRISLFPTKDLQEIYLKSWNSDGRLLVFRYILDPNQNLNAQSQPQEDTTRTDILKRLDQLEKQVASNARKANQRTSGKGEE